MPTHTVNAFLKVQGRVNTVESPKLEFVKFPSFKSSYNITLKGQIPNYKPKYRKSPAKTEK